MTESESETIRVLIVDDYAETRENIRKLLQFEADIEVVGSARTGEEAIQLSSDTKPDVVLMDINMPDMDGIEATERLLSEVSYAQVVMLSVNSEPDYMRRAMLAGARDFIAKPPSGDELISTIRLVSERAREQRQKMMVPVEAVIPAGGIPGMPGTGQLRPEGKIVTLYSAKGGVGCSTLATNLAVGLNTEETKVVLVDTNLQFGDAAVLMNLQVKNSIVDLAARPEEIDPEIVDEVLIRHESGLRLLAAPPRPEMADEIQADQVRRVIGYLRRQFAYVIVDTSSTMDDVTLAVLDATDLLVVVSTPEIPAIKDARLTFDLLSVLEFPKERIFFLINKTDRKAGITPEAIAENLKREVDGEIPTDEKAFALSINRGVPLLLTEKGRSPAKNILEVIGTIKQRLLAEEQVEEGEPEAARTGLFGR